MNAPAEYSSYLSQLGFVNFQKPYAITAKFKAGGTPRTKTFHVHSIDSPFRPHNPSWEEITAALDAALILEAERTTKDIDAVVSVVEGLARDYGVYLDGFLPLKVHRRSEFIKAMIAR